MIFRFKRFLLCIPVSSWKQGGKPTNEDWKFKKPDFLADDWFTIMHIHYNEREFYSNLQEFLNGTVTKFAQNSR